MIAKPFWTTVDVLWSSRATTLGIRHFERLYCIVFEQQGVTRGHHAHKALQQVLIVLNGAVSIMLDDGKRRETLEITAGQTQG